MSFTMTKCEIIRSRLGVDSLHKLQIHVLVHLLTTVEIKERSFISSSSKRSSNWRNLKTPPFHLPWTENILKRDLFENDEVTR